MRSGAVDNLGMFWKHDSNNKVIQKTFFFNFWNNFRLIESCENTIEFSLHPVFPNVNISYNYEYYAGN